MIEYEIIIGLVKNGNFYTRSPEPEISAPTLLTEIKVIESIPPELRLIVFHMMIGISGNKRIRNGELIGTR